jgi:pimeloyl-ACP methyl ester carboxylesterase
MRFLLLTLLFFVPFAQAQRIRDVALPSGRTVRVCVITPPGFDPTRPTPVVLVLPPGNQNEAMVEEAVRRYFEAGALKAGWVVICPAAPATPPNTTFVTDPAPLIEFLGVLPTIATPEPGGVHLAGVSNGGIAALRIARLSAGRLASVTVLPGFHADPIKPEEWSSLAGIPVTIWVGENDQDLWKTQARATADALTLVGAEVHFEIIKGQGHVLDMGPSRVMDTLEAARVQVLEKIAVARELDDFHDAAAKADEPRYFAHFTPDAVFIGTDAKERWTLPAFRAWVKSGNYFAPGRGWAYTPKQRQISFNADRTTAWFDETLENAKLGSCRGSGVLIKSAGRWLVAQYNLSVPVPNELMTDVVRQIRDAKRVGTP